MAVSYPFAAIVGQEEMKRALLLAAIDRAIGGVFVFGDRGTGKSTAARALAAVLPAMDVVEGCPFNCDPAGPPSACASVCTRRAGGAAPPIARVPVPVIDLPLGATEDRVVGALDLQLALTRGEKAYEPGLLARAHRGFLYIDEVNLLEDHLVDLLLDAAASGEAVVEREGLSVRHAARFILVGSGNPEEGELRPQLLDRFGLSVDVRTPETIADRITILRRCDAFDRDPAGFAREWEGEAETLRARIAAARGKLPAVTISDARLGLISRLCGATGADGLRGELAMMRAARAAAALAGDAEVTEAHIAAAAPLALRHRLRRDPLDETGSTARIDRALAELIPA